MRKFCICSLLILFILAQCSYSQRTDDCMNKHPFMATLEFLGAQINKVPQRNVNTCRGDWNRFDTCCEESSFRQLVSNKLASNQDMLQKFESQMATIEAKINSIVKQAQVDILNGEKLQGFPKDGMRQALQRFQFFSGPTNSFQELLNWIHSFKTQSSVNQRRCVNYLNKVHGASLCSLCSGRSEDYITPEKKIKMSESTCRSIVTECGPAWKLILELVDTAKRSAQNHAGHHGGNCHAHANFLVGDSMQFADKYNLGDYFSNCHGSIQGCPFDIVQPLCESIIRIDKLDYLATITKAVKRNLKTSVGDAGRSILGSLKRKIFKAMLKKLSPVKLWKSLKKLKPFSRGKHRKHHHVAPTHPTVHHPVVHAPATHHHHVQVHVQHHHEHHHQEHHHHDSKSKSKSSHRLLQLATPEPGALPPITVVPDTTCQVTPCPIWSINP